MVTSKLKLKLALVVLATVVSSGCSYNRTTGRPQFVLVSEGKEVELGAEKAELIVKQVGLVEDPALTEYVSQLGALLVKGADTEVAYHFYVLDMPEPNAFALPGGYVFVTRGLLALANSEGELANVIGHEVGHVLARHSTQQISLAAPLAVVTGLSGLAIGLVSPALGSVVAGTGGLANSLFLAPYSRDQERQADRIGMKLAATAGWNPAAMAVFLNSLDRDELQRNGEARQSTFLASHPTTPERVAETRKEAQALGSGKAGLIAAAPTDFLRHLDGLIVGENPAKGVFADNRFLHPGLGFVLDFPKEWKTGNEADYVAAVSPDEKAACVLSASEKDKTPQEAAEKAAKAAGLTPDSVEKGTVKGLLSASLEGTLTGEGGKMRFAATWIAHRDNVYQLIGISKPEDFNRFRAQIGAASKSFHAMSGDERVTIRVGRLRLELQRPGETLSALGKRTGAMWSGEEIAVANGLEGAARDTGGRILKVAQREPYQSF